MQVAYFKDPGFLRPLPDAVQVSFLTTPLPPLPSVNHQATHKMSKCQEMNQQKLPAIAFAITRIDLN